MRISHTFLYFHLREYPFGTKSLFHSVFQQQAQAVEQRVVGQLLYFAVGCCAFFVRSGIVKEIIVHIFFGYTNVDGVKVSFFPFFGQEADAGFLAAGYHDTVSCGESFAFIINYHRGRTCYDIGIKKIG